MDGLLLSFKMSTTYYAQNVQIAYHVTEQRLCSTSTVHIKLM
jgi:hypothetical protein